MTEKNEVAISGEFPRDIAKPGNCIDHPMNKSGSCGFYTGHEHAWVPEGEVRPQSKREWLADLAKATGATTIEQVQDTALDVYHYIVAHQSLGEKVVLLNPAQQRQVARYDKIGLLYLPKFYKAPSSVTLDLQSHELKGQDD